MTYEHEATPDLPAGRLDPRLLDRWLDGELEPAAQRALLQQCEAAPELWKQCALAFAEHLAWRQDLRGMPGRPVPAPDRPGRVAAPSHGARRRAGLASLAAAGVVCVFCAGWLVHARWAEPGMGNPVVQKLVSEPSPPAVDEPPAAVAARDADNAVAADEAPPVHDERLAGVLLLKFDDHGEPRELRVPVIDGHGIDPQKWLATSRTFDPVAVKAFERGGHKVAAQRQLVTFRLQDGRQLLLPVDRLDVRLKRRVYQ